MRTAIVIGLGLVAYAINPKIFDAVFASINPSVIFPIIFIGTGLFVMDIADFGRK